MGGVWERVGGGACGGGEGVDGGGVAGGGGVCGRGGGDPNLQGPDDENRGGGCGSRIASCLSMGARRGMNSIARGPGIGRYIGSVPGKLAGMTPPVLANCW